MRRNQQTLAALGLLAVAFGCYSPVSEAAGPGGQLRDFKDLLATATKLESAEMVLEENKLSKLTEKRNDMLYLFAREVKSSHCNRHYEQMMKTSDEFRLKAYSHVDDSKKQKNWWGNIVSSFGSPLAGMKALGRSNPYLNTVAERYESQAKDGKLSQVDVDCDMIRFQVRSLHAIMFVLQTDIKYLVMENQQVLNKAIYEQLKSDKFISNVNFYEIHDLNSDQSHLLLRYFGDRSNTEETTVGQAVDHFHNPGPYIIGRLLDSCQTVVRLVDDWREHERGHNEVCSKSTSDPNGKLFSKNYKFDKYNDTFAFCQNFLDAL